MQGIKFKEANHVLKGFDNVEALHVNESHGIITSKWKMSFLERIKVLFTGVVWFSILQSKTHAPIKLSCNNEIKEEFK